MVAFYAPVILQKAGFSDPSTAIGLSIFVFIANLFCVLIAYGLVDRLGRRPLLLAGSLAMMLGHIALAVVYLLGWPAFYAFFAVIFIQGVSNITWGPLAWVVLGEIFPGHIRDKAMSAATFSLWIAMFASVQFVPSIVSYFERIYGSGGITFLIFATICVLAYVFVWRMLPETKGRTLEEIAGSWVVREKSMSNLAASSLSPK